MTKKPDSKPYLEGFNPYIIPMQGELMNIINDWDYDASTPEILLSGAYGSSKTIVVAHIAIMHCLNNPGAVVFIGRRSLPDLKKTFYSELCEHLNTPGFQEGLHYKTNDTRAEVTLPFVGSKIISGSWADRKYKKFRSLKISMAIFEEAAENDLQDREAFMNIKARLRRLPSVKENILIAITNPDSPEHWLFEYFIEGQKKHKSRMVLYSITTDNPFLDEIYVQQLLEDLSPKEVRRYIYGEWLSLQGEVVYSCYDSELNFSNTDYEIDMHYPIGMTCDFNIGHGKPMSWNFFQYIDDHFHFFDEVVIFSARTENALQDAYERGLFAYPVVYNIYGDAAGKHKSTNSRRSDYQIIYDFLEEEKVNFSSEVLASNPAIRYRHNRVNAYCCNGLNKRRLTIYKKCKMLDKGMKLTKIKKGADYIEDDGPSCPWQHGTTALGYAICAIDGSKERTSHQRQL